MKKGFVASVIVLVLAVLCFPLLFPSSPFQTVGAESLTPITVLNDPGGKHETDARIHVFFDALMKGNTASAFDEIFRQSTAKSPLEKEQFSMMMTGRVNEMSVRLGKMLDYKIYDTKWIDEDIVFSRYILKCEDGPAVWTFMFYRTPTTTTGITNNNPWRLHTITFEGDLRPLLLQ